MLVTYASRYEDGHTITPAVITSVWMLFEGNINSECSWKRASTLSALQLPGTLPLAIDFRRPTICRAAALLSAWPTKLFCAMMGAASPAAQSSVFKIAFHIYVSFFSLVWVLVPWMERTPISSAVRPHTARARPARRQWLRGDEIWRREGECTTARAAHEPKTGVQ